MNTGLVTLLLDRGRLGVPDPYLLRKDAAMTRRPRGVLPAGAGAVFCLDCGAGARADGKGTPIVLHHADDCPNHPSNTPPAPPRKVWYLDRSMYEVGKGFRPVIQVEGEHGFRPQGGGDVEPYYLGHDYATAKRIVDEWNSEMGIDPAEAREIVLDAMFPERRDA